MDDLLEVFILTYNRANLVESAIRSVLRQTVKVRLTVVDNHSTDGTVALVDRLHAEGYDFGFVRRDENGRWPGNFETARQHFHCPYVMLFSDDDILHPQYIESALLLLRENKDVDLIYSASREFRQEAEVSFGHYSAVPVRVIEGQTRFAAFTFVSQVVRPSLAPSLPNIIYRREYLERAKVLDEHFGKVADRPFIIEGVQDGIVLSIEVPMLFYRVHGGSDTLNPKTACTLVQLENIVKYYANYMRRLPETTRMYDLVAARNLKALSNYANTGMSTSRLLGYAYRQHLIGMDSLPALAERVLHKLGMKRDGLAESALARALDEISSVQSISLV